MTASRAIDFTIERQRLAGFVGCAELLARLDQLVIVDAPRGWHILRHGVGTHAAMFGVNPRKLMLWMGVQCRRAAVSDRATTFDRCWT